MRPTLPIKGVVIHHDLLLSRTSLHTGYKEKQEMTTEYRIGPVNIKWLFSHRKTLISSRE